jgi:hypothetical protein
VTANSAWADRSGIAKPFAWGNLELPLAILACGLVGAFFAWRRRQRALAK